MTTQLTRSVPIVDEPRQPSPRKPTVRSGVAWSLLGCAVFALIVLVAHNARYGAVATRIKNPAVHGYPIPVSPLFGWTHWVALLQVFTVIQMVLLVVLFVVLWRRYPKHPVLLMAIVCTTLDPLWIRQYYAAYVLAARAGQRDPDHARIADSSLRCTGRQ